MVLAFVCWSFLHGQEVCIFWGKEGRVRSNWNGKHIPPELWAKEGYEILCSENIMLPP